MPIRDRIVQRQISQVAPVYVLILRYFGRENDSVRLNAPLLSLPEQVLLGIGRVLQQPQDRIRDPLQYIHPNTEGEGVNLVQLVEVRKNKFVLRQVVLLPRGSLGLEYELTRLFVVVREVAMRHVDSLFGVQTFQGFRGGANLVSD